MKFIKTKIVAILIASNVVTIPVVAMAQSLIIANATTINLAFTVNGVCSNELGMINGYPWYEVKFLSDAELKNICGGNLKICEIDAYINSCTGVYAGGISIHKRNAVVKSSTDDKITATVNFDNQGFGLFFTDDRAKPV